MDSNSDQEHHSDRDALRPTIHTLGINRKYVRSWLEQDAFRELYQNWKDAIIFRFSLSQRSFKTKVVESIDEIQILVHSPVDQSTFQRTLLGYISFDRKKGSVEITNFQASLERRNLDLGSSTKCGNNTMAGTHGEGLKLAALVLRREKRRVRITSSKYNWTFGFRGPTKSIFFCKLTPVPPTQLGAVHTIAGKLKADPATDVCILIDKGRDGNPISETEFRTWLKVSLDVERPKDPSDIIETPHGDLILDNSYAGKMYLKGLLLPSGGSTVKTQHAGYNLLQGQINRDRQQLKNENDESRTLMYIWESAIGKHGDQVLDRYIDLLQKNYDCVDVNQAEHLVSKSTAAIIWQRLKTNSNDKFYYDRDSPGASSEVEIIKRTFKRQAVPLSSKLWKVIRKIDHVRTPHEQRTHLFQNSPTSDKPITVFSRSIQDGLRTCLALHPRTLIIQIEYVTGAATDIDMLFDKKENLLKIDDKWLDFALIHEAAPCRSSMARGVQLAESYFFCDHLIEGLYELALHEIVESLKLSQGDASTFKRLMRLKVREKLQEMPREVSTQFSHEPLALVISWTSEDSERLKKALLRNGVYSVTLHRESTCSSKRFDQLHTSCQQVDDIETVTINGLETSSKEITETCGCRCMKVSRLVRSVVFSNLDPQERYFPMVALDEELSFYGNVPEGIRPLTERPTESTQPMLIDGGQQNIYHEDQPRRTASSHNPNENENENEQNQQSCPIHDENLHSEWQSSQEEMWSNWEKKNFQSTFDTLFSSRSLRTLDLPCVAYYPSLELSGFVFMINEYAQIRLDPESETTGPREFVIFVHSILCEESKDEKTQYHLLVSRYSFLESSHPFSYAEDLMGPMTRKELVLHFTDFVTMGSSQDGEIIPISHISEAKPLEFESAPNVDPVQLVTHAPADLAISGFYCRFAIRSRVADEPACITPLASNLLRYHERWKIPRYDRSIKPVVIDLSPSVLGLAEGFWQEGFEVVASLGFDTVHDMTWKARYPSAEVYDGIQSDVYGQIAEGQLVQPPWLQSGTVKVAVIGPCHHHFGHYRNENARLVIESISKTLQVVRRIIGTFAQDTNCFDVLVCALPAVALHPGVLPDVMKTIYSLLGRRYCIHIQKTHFTDHRILIDKSLVFILAFPICAALRWDQDRSGSIRQKIEDIIGDLTFQNPRASFTNDESQYGLKCKKPFVANETIYNHETNLAPIPNVSQPVAMDSSTALKLPLFRDPSFVHPVRNDLLTVREIARIFGFPDELVFYNGPRGSYHYFNRAIPPTVSKVVARGVRGILEQLLGRRLEEDSSMEVVLMSSRALKRQRCD